MRVRLAFISVVATVVAIIGVVAVAMLTHQAAPSPIKPAANASPTRDVATAEYVNVINNDVDALDVQVYKKFACKTRDLCISELQDIRNMVESMVSDIKGRPTPPVFDHQVPAIRLAAQELIAQIDSTLSLMQQPNSNYVALSGSLDVHPLDLAAGAIVCWPKSALSVEGGESPSGYVCR